MRLHVFLVGLGRRLTRLTGRDWIFICVAVFAVAAPSIWLCGRSAIGAHRVLAVYDDISGHLNLIDAFASGRPPRTLLCVQLGRWAIRVGVRDGYLVTLDPDSRAFQFTSLETLERVADGREDCPAASSRVGTQIPLRSAKLPYRGRFGAGKLFVTYFADNLVEVYEWTPPTGSRPPDVRFSRDIRFSAPENLGLGDTSLDGDTLLVAATGYFNFARSWSRGRFHDPHIFLVDLRDPPRWPLPEIRPANVNSLLFYFHPGTGVRYVLNAGDIAGGYSSLQRVRPGPELGPEIKLPRASGIAGAFPLGLGAFAVWQLAGEHLFLVDARTDALRRIVRFAGVDFRNVPLDTAALPERSESEFQDLLPDPTAEDRFFLIDAKGERLIHVRFNESDFSMSVLRVTSLRTEAYRTFFYWGFWLDRVTVVRPPEAHLPPRYPFLTAQWSAPIARPYSAR